MATNASGQATHSTCGLEHRTDSTPAQAAALLCWPRLHSTRSMMVLSVIFMVPLVWIVSSSLKTQGQVFAYPPVWIPNPIVWSNYVEALNRAPLLRWLMNTAIITGFAIAGNVITSSMVAFGFARLRFPGRGSALHPAAQHDDAAAGGDADPSLHHVPMAGLARHLPAPDRAAVLWRRRLQYLPGAPVLHDHSQGLRRSGPHRRRLELGDLAPGSWCRYQSPF